MVSRDASMLVMADRMVVMAASIAVSGSAPAASGPPGKGMGRGFTRELSLSRSIPGVTVCNRVNPLAWTGRLRAGSLPAGVL